MIRGALLFAAGAVGLALLAPSVFDGATAPSTADPGPAAAAPPAEDAAGDKRRRPSGRRVSRSVDRGRPARAVFGRGARRRPAGAHDDRHRRERGDDFRLDRRPARPLAASGPKWTVKTANGMTVASPVTLDSLSFGGLYMNRVEALILAPEAGEVNLIGASFLRRLVSVEQRDGVLILRQ